LIFLLFSRAERRKIGLDGTANKLTDDATFSVRDVCSGAFHPAVAYSVAPAPADEKHAVISGCGGRTWSLYSQEFEQYQTRMKGKRMFSERYCALWVRKDGFPCLFRKTNVLSEVVMSLSQTNNLTIGQMNGTILSEVYLDSGCSVRKRII